MAFASCKRPRKRASGERGQALLEMLPVVSLLLLITFGVVECSYALWQLEVITALTREGSNLASRGATLPGLPPSLMNTLQASANAVITDGSVLNLANNGEVIVTAVQRQSTGYVIIGQYPSGNYAASSRIGAMGGSAALPAIASPIPVNNTIYVTEVFTQYSSITPLGAFVNITMPSTLYDVAYF